MKRNLAMIVLALALCMALALQKTSAANDEAAIRQNLDEWARAFERHDINGIMAMYAPNVVAYDFIPPLQYRGRDTYRKDYEEFLAQFDGPVKVEFRDMT